MSPSRIPARDGNGPPPLAGLLLGREAAAQQDKPIGFTGVPANAPTGGLGRLLTYEGEGHLLTFAPTGAGKGVGPVICNALIHPGPLIVVDIKGEVYRATAKRRQEMGQKVYLLDLRGGTGGDALNPLDLAMLGNTDTAATARGFAAELVERGHEERDRFWNDWAETMLTAGCSWLIDDCKPENRNLGYLFDLLTGQDPPYEIADLLDKQTIKTAAAVAAFNAFLALPHENTRPSVLGSTITHLRLFDSALVRRVTGTTTIDIAALIAGEPVTIYITVPAIRLTAMRPLLRMWLSGLMFALMQREGKPERRTLILADELGNLGRIDALVTAFTLMRSSGVTLWGFLQNPAQLAIYGSQARTILDNAGVVQVFGARNRQMAADYANLVGGDAEAIMKMGKDEQLLLIEGGEPVKAKRLRYFAETEFSGLYEGMQAQPER